MCRLFAVIAMLAIGCRGDDPTARAPQPAPVVEVADAAAPEPELDVSDALPVWTAVVRRDELLARRGATGVIVGVLRGDRLVDDTEGGGALSARVDLPDGAAFTDGDRIAALGAWVARDGAWWWVGERARSLGPGTAAERAPGLEVAAASAPEGAVPASAAPRAGGPITFAVLGTPLRHGDGWPIADEPGGAQVAWLLLPGERSIYGGQELLTADERWSLRPGARYAVVIERHRARGELPVLRAAAPPVSP